MTGPARYRLEFTDDPRAFLRLAAGFLATDPVVTTVIAAWTLRAAARWEAGEVEPADFPRWWLSVHDDAEGAGAVVGVAMRTAPFNPHPLYVLPMPDEAARQVGRALAERGEEVVGVNGALPAAERLAAEVARRHGLRAWVHEHTRLHVLESLVEPPAPEGRARTAVPSDLRLARSWFAAFHADAAEQAGRSLHADDEGQFDLLQVKGLIDEGRVWMWEDAHGRPASMVGFNPPSYGVARIGPVYTPGERRKHGFASALTAHVSRLLRDTGSRVCLFTDQANPTSNKIYAQIGYVPVVDMANLAITATIT